VRVSSYPHLLILSVLPGTTVRFTWDHVNYAAQFEVREGTVWESAFFRFRTSGLQGDIDPLLYGDYFFLIEL
jgi:hypothetical protein